ncbi:unnamed protein product [Blepharisma stoltei]|uniref:RING-type domain-containing protein n=1 Tax=Blepharisma stoltei TaxID=1481888 RepID=A0AAU9JWF6_9CILI|nr:unnamed protein product [Blepharisma stoltei]
MSYLFAIFLHENRTLANDYSLPIQNTSIISEPFKSDIPYIFLYLTGDHIRDWKYINGLYRVLKKTLSDRIFLDLSFEYYSNLNGTEITDDCIASGRYCLKDSQSINLGRDLVIESLRSLCFLKKTRKNSESSRIFIEYLELISNYCRYSYASLCSKIYLYAVGQSPSEILKCVNDSVDGTDILVDDNRILQKEFEKNRNFSYIAPTIIINGEEFDSQKGSLLELYCNSLKNPPKSCQAHQSDDENIGPLTIFVLISCSIVGFSLSKLVIIGIIKYCCLNSKCFKMLKPPIHQRLEEKAFASDLEFLGESVCTICLTELSENDKVKITTCRHIFHSSCLNEWLILKSFRPRCPNCNLNPVTSHN